MDWALAEIKKIQTAARTGEPIVKPRWPVIILRTPKGLNGPKSFHGELIEGSFHSHQVPLPNAVTSDDELAVLGEWLKSYKPEELFNDDGSPIDEVLRIVPAESARKLGQKSESYKAYVPLDLPKWTDFGVEKGSEESCMKTIGQFLKGVIAKYVQPLIDSDSRAHSALIGTLQASASFLLMSSYQTSWMQSSMTRAAISSGMLLHATRVVALLRSCPNILAKACFKDIL